MLICYAFINDNRNNKDVFWGDFLLNKNEQIEYLEQHYEEMSR